MLESHYKKKPKKQKKQKLAFYKAPLREQKAKAWNGRESAGI
jgi:hypothetical protein